MIASISGKHDGVTDSTGTKALTEDQVKTANALERIFMPSSRARRDSIAASRQTIRHYTSAEAALSIIRSKAVWMRNTTCMSDYREVHHGFELFNSVLQKDDNRSKLSQALDSIAPKAVDRAIDFFNQWWRDIQFNTYISSVSEHDPREDIHGRLSMWRAFGGNTARVGIVLRVPQISLGAAALNIIFSPVAYFTGEQVETELNEVLTNINSNAEFLRNIDHDIIVNTLFYSFVINVTCRKHEGFQEEREWRAIYSPKRWPSPLMHSSLGGRRGCAATYL